MEVNKSSFPMLNFCSAEILFAKRSRHKKLLLTLMSCAVLQFSVLDEVSAWEAFGTG